MTDSNVSLAANPFHQILDGLPLLGDTTANQALIFSPPLSNANTTHIDEPTYPNYILPPANTSLPDGAPALPVDVSVFIAPTSTSDLPSLPRTGCAIRAATFKDSHFKDSERTKDNGLWLRDASGWRWQWLLSGLTPLTNYTTYVIENGTKVSGPINFVTKSGAFLILKIRRKPHVVICRLVRLSYSALIALLSRRKLRRTCRGATNS